jgi:hypothetical protein
MNNKWKDALLKSGLPLEYEVATFLENNKNCLLKNDHSYLKEDESSTVKEFSYDLNASYIKMPYDVELMIECKFRSPNTKWYFMPKQYGGMEEIHQNSFIHAIDHFHPKWSWKWEGYLPFELAPLCSKGIEIYDCGEHNNKSIEQAVMQLSYGFAEQITETIIDHIDEKYGIRFWSIFIPIIITTAELFRFKTNLTLEAISKADDPMAIAEPHDILIINGNKNLSLYKHNMNVFHALMAEQGELLVKNIKSFTDDIQHLFQVLAKYYCPAALVVIHHTQDNYALNKMFEYIDQFLFPTKEVKDKMTAYKTEIERRFKDLKTKRPPTINTNTGN